jgi:F-box protein 21
MDPVSKFGELPDEVIAQIISLLPSEDIIANVQLVSRRLRGICLEPLLWRYHCKVSFRYWDSSRNIRQKFWGRLEDTDWRSLFLDRRRIHHRTSSILDSILSEQINRIGRIERIASFGYDAKDTLLGHINNVHDETDALARRSVWQMMQSRLTNTKADIGPRSS